MKISIDEIQKVFDDVYGKLYVKKIDTVFEKSDNGKYYKLIISIHNLSYKELVIVHTKFIFDVDIEKSYILNNNFRYLYDINCKYKIRNFDTIENLNNILLDILDTNDFGNDIKIISDFLSSPTVFLNYYLNREKIENINVYDFQYDPDYSIRPCNETSFKFKINISNKYNIIIELFKKSDDNYHLISSSLDYKKEINIEDINNFSFIVGSLIIDTLTDLNVIE